MKNFALMITVALFVACGEAQMSIPSSLKNTDLTASEIKQLRNQIVKSQRRIQELELRIECMLELHNNGEKKYIPRDKFYDFARGKNKTEILRRLGEPHHRTKERENNGVLENLWAYREMSYDSINLRVDSHVTLNFSNDKLFAISFSAPLNNIDK